MLSELSPAVISKPAGDFCADPVDAEQAWGMTLEEYVQVSIYLQYFRCQLFITGTEQGAERTGLAVSESERFVPGLEPASALAAGSR